MRLSVNLILYEICCGQGQALSLRFNVFFKFDNSQTGDLSVTCFGKEEQRNECEAIKNRRKRYVACDDVVDVNGLEPLTLRTSSECSTN